ENILDLLKELALKGKLVFVVIHQPASDIFKMFDKLIILDTGGWLIYNGDPVESIIYFKSRIQHANWNESECHNCGNVTPEQIFNIVESNVLDEFGKITNTRKISPKEWNVNYLKGSLKDQTKLETINEIPKIAFKIPNIIKQCLIFARRNILTKLADTQYIVFNLFEAPILAFFLAILIKYFNVSNEMGYNIYENENLPIFMFMSVLVAIFMGLSVSAEEIIKDRKLLKREAFLNLSWSSYLISKVAVLFIVSAIQAFAFVIVGNTIMEIKGMYWQYWLVMFSCWATSNMMGLVISDSFKAVVTIYMCIPFLVIPHIILSGVFVKFEKLNPSLSSPNKIPWYGELITARWGYEALAVYHFMNNKFEKQFYSLDKAISTADFKKIYWYPEMKNRLEAVERNYQDQDKKEEVINALEVLRNEINKELNDNTVLKFDLAGNLYYEKLTPELIDQTKNYIERLKRYYTQVRNIVNSKKDSIITYLDNADREKYRKMRRDYLNEALEEFVKNSNESQKIMEYKGELVRKFDPIFLDPQSKFIKAHFYAPKKQLFGKYYNTLWVNILAIWLMTILLYGVLNYRLLKKFLDSFEQIGSMFAKTEE
ncbi:MAG: ABC transporter permease, partial [Bacteroidales bacterium]|nr:ABC transporter permease [Bacteroidales bacterium]